MTDEDAGLRARIARSDPACRPEAADLLRAVTPDEIRERAMRTIEDRTATTTGTARSRWRRLPAVLGAAASLLAITVGVVAVTRDGRAPERGTGGTSMALTAPAGGAVMSSCVPFDVAILRDMPVAFGGTVTDVASGAVTLDVDRWYKGGTASRVTISSPSDAMVSIEGVEFAVGGRYLVTATDGTVNACGYSGPATRDLERAYAEAFGAG